MGGTQAESIHRFFVCDFLSKFRKLFWKSLGSLLHGLYRENKSSAQSYCRSAQDEDAFIEVHELEWICMLFFRHKSRLAHDYLFLFFDQSYQSIDLKAIFLDKLLFLSI